MIEILYTLPLLTIYHHVNLISLLIYIESCQASQTNTNQIQAKTNQYKPKQTNTNQCKLIETDTNKYKPIEIKTNQYKTNAIQ